MDNRNYMANSHWLTRWRHHHTWWHRSRWHPRWHSSWSSCHHHCIWIVWIERRRLLWRPCAWNDLIVIAIDCTQCGKQERDSANGCQKETRPLQSWIWIVRVDPEQMKHLIAHKNPGCARQQDSEKGKYRCDHGVTSSF